ncbi:hypothetical protein [Sutcliffiella deserti]|uniref:hypothetical protein n=1 Tax=Sutcliffiella deserti TaxID=2875501 RepID=UPI001CBE4702|nr:hypothetical protein [Sutcliffiella deserti]
MTNILHEKAQWTEFHRNQAIQLFNQVWDLLEKEDRTEEEDFLMIHKAHASRYHWTEIGEPVNFSRGEWQISRVYAVIGRAESSLVHAKRNLSICLEHKIEDFDLAFAYEAMARAYSLLSQYDLKEEYLQMAKEAASHIIKDGDRKLILENLKTIL